MRFRKLQIAWSAGWGVVAVLLCVLWGRSYHTGYRAVGQFTATYGFRMDSLFGGIKFETIEWSGRSFAIQSASLVVEDHRFLASHQTVLGFSFGRSGYEYVVILPYWFLVLSSATLVAAPWIRWPKRFGLRTLLIATAIIAVVLGVNVWMSRAG